MRLLVVEDEMKVASFLKRGLEAENYAVDIATDGEDGLHLATSQEYDLILLDILLPKVNGLQVLERLRSRNIRTPSSCASAPSCAARPPAGAPSCASAPSSWTPWRTR